MAHPQMFDDADPRLRRVREIAMSLPDAAEKVSHGRPAFYTTKVFAYYGGSLRIDTAWVQHPQCIVVLVEADEREALLADSRVFVPAYLGPSRWLGVDLPPLRPARGWEEIGELVESSYRLTAGRRRVAALDARPARVP